MFRDAIHPASLSLLWDPLRRTALLVLMVLAGASSALRAADSVALTGEMVDTSESRDFVVAGRVLQGTPWLIERSMFLAGGGSAPGQEWFPFAAGDAGFTPAGFQTWFQPVTGVGESQFMTGAVQSFPLLPPAPPPTGVGAGPRVSYVSVHAVFMCYVDGSSMATWISGGNGSGSGTAVSARFTPVELDLSDPTASGRAPMGVNILHSASSDPAPRLVASYVIWPSPAATAPAAGALTNSFDQAVRAFYVARAAQIRADLFPPQSAEPPPPPTPVTVDRRSFFRLRPDGAAAVDVNNNGIPDAIENGYAEPVPGLGALIISEACFLNLAATSGDLVGGESADWVEIWNRSGSTVNTAGYFLSNDAAISSTALEQELALPVVDLAAGETLVVHCTAQGRARLLVNDPGGLLPYTAPFDLKEKGERIYLYQQISGGFAEVSRLDPPSAAISLPPGISYGIRAQGTNYGYGWFQRPTRGQANQGWLSGGELVLPGIEDADSPPTAPVLLKGRVFRTGTIRARLTHPEPDTALLYTLNGEEPTHQSAVYDGAEPIAITGTTVLRVRAMKTGRLPSRTVTRSFIHTPTVPAQRLPGFTGTPTLPVCNPAITATYGDTGTVPAALAGYPAAGRILEQLEARPTVSIASTGSRIGTALDQPDGAPVSVEYIDPSNPAAYFQQNAGATVSGNHSGSYSLRFGKAFTLDGKSGTQGPVLAATGKSAIFPDSPVTTFSRLLLRCGSGNSWQNIGNPGAVYYSDPYMKELSRAMGTLTAQRRWVHLYLNGVYHGVSDLEEFMDDEWVSRHLIAQNPGTPAASLEPEDILFYRKSQAYPDPAAVAGWQTVMNTAAAATDPALSQSARDAAWAATQQHLNLNQYIDHILTFATVNNRDLFGGPQFRMWRHPLTGKWQVIAWDGDSLEFRYLEGGGNFSSDSVLSTIMRTDFPDDLMPHQSLKTLPAYRSLFSARLTHHLKSSSGNTSPALTQAAILAKFDGEAAAVRLTLECEAMRWVPGGSGPHPFVEPPVNKGLHYLSQWGVNTADNREKVAQTRNDIKISARDGYLLNDIPPPVITISGNTATIAKPSGVTGRIYYRIEEQSYDPKLFVSSPSATPELLSVSEAFPPNASVIITARIFGPDIDGDLAWSSLSTRVYP